MMYYLKSKNEAYQLKKNLSRMYHIPELIITGELVPICRNWPELLQSKIKLIDWDLEKAVPQYEKVYIESWNKRQNIAYYSRTIPNYREYIESISTKNIASQISTNLTGSYKNCLFNFGEIGLTSFVEYLQKEKFNLKNIQVSTPFQQFNDYSNLEFIIQLNKSIWEQFSQRYNLPVITLIPINISLFMEDLTVIRLLDFIQATNNAEVILKFYGIDEKKLNEQELINSIRLIKKLEALPQIKKIYIVSGFGLYYTISSDKIVPVFNSHSVNKYNWNVKSSIKKRRGCHKPTPIYKLCSECSQFVNEESCSIIKCQNTECRRIFNEEKIYHKLISTWKNAEKIINQTYDFNGYQNKLNYFDSIRSKSLI